MEEQSVGHETLAQNPVRPFIFGLEKVRLTEATQKFELGLRGGAVEFRLKYFLHLPIYNFSYQLSRETDPIHLLRYGVSAGIDSGRCRVIMWLPRCYCTHD